MLIVLYVVSTSLGRNQHVLPLPAGWLCYLAPELVRVLRAELFTSCAADSTDGTATADVPFSFYSDVFAFGTVWYELLFGDWPYRDVPAETLVYLVGSARRPALRDAASCSRDVVLLLMLCWDTSPQRRPSFLALNRLLEGIPKKRLDRSPSHPVGAVSPARFAAEALY